MSAFQGVRVLDLSQGQVGPMSAMLFGDYGATVLKIEPLGGDRAKDRPGYLAWNRNKAILALDPMDADGRARLERLIAGADVLVVDHGPTALAALGLTGEAVTAQHPRLIHLWTPPFGTAGAWSDLPAHHAMLTGLCGAAWRQASYADQPTWHVTPIVHGVQALLAATAGAAALYEREQTGRGQTVVVSGLHAMAEVACQITAVGEPSYYRGSPTGGSLGYRLYRCGDGQWLFLGALFSHFFYRALSAVGLLGGDMYDMGGSLEAKLMSGPRDHWVERLQAAEVPAGPVRRRDAWLGSEIASANALVATLEGGGCGAVRMPGVLAKLRGTPGAAARLPRPATKAEVEAFALAESAPASRAERKPKPLAGVRVLDLGTVIAGAYAGSILANFGADVVKVESPDGDPFRGMGGGFMNYNRGKRGLGLDLKPPAGRALFHDLAQGADVVLDNYRLGVRERLGIDHAALAKVNPRIISCSAITYGSQGSLARQPGFDGALQAWSGQMAAQGGEGGEPVFHSIPINDVATAALTAFAIAAALYARERTGEGQDVETSLAAAATALQFGDLVTFEGSEPAPQGARDCVGFAALERYYRCRGGWITLACTGAEQFEGLAEALGRAEWLRRWPGDSALAEPPDGPLARAVAEALAEMARDDVLQRLAAASVPAAPVLRPEETHRCEFFWDNGYFQLYGDSWGGQLVGSKGFATFNGEAASFDRLNPGLGEHGVEVLVEHGIGRDRMQELAKAGVIFRG